MPGDDGLTLTRELRQTSEIGIIILTGKEGSVERVVGQAWRGRLHIEAFDERELLARRRLYSDARPAAMGLRSGGATLRRQLQLNLDGRELRHERMVLWR